MIFAAEDDYSFYLSNLREWKEKLECRLHAFCLMANHVHLIVDPGEDGERLAMLMKRTAGRQTRYANRIARRSGTLWEGRYKSSPISANEYLLACCRYIELNPVRAGLVVSPEQYRWSSCGVKVGSVQQDWLDLDPTYLALGASERERQETYRAYLNAPVPAGEVEQIRGAVQRGQLTGTVRFIKEVEARVGKRIEFRGPGRPKKAGK
jgi:putative transposase